ncbi:MAG: YabP/YqfC family sporulation protein [Erysipelotrichales bacterium]|nr:YabP/YqfC family sporulation protein [Erysipelotrichales bacterium]
MIYMEQDTIRISEYKQIIDVTKEEIKLQYLNSKLKIQGSNLQLVMMSKEELMIQGKIEMVYFYE